MPDSGRDGGRAEPAKQGVAVFERETQEIGLLGAGGQAVELRGYSPASIRFYAIEKRFIRDVRSDGLIIDITDPPLGLRGYPVVAAVGAPRLKQNLLQLWPGGIYARVIAEAATVANDAEIGEGSIIAPGARIMADVKIGVHTLINTNSVISHESHVGDYCTISPGTNIGGRCVLGNGAFIGIGATLLDGVTIGRGAVVGAGAVVRHDVAPFDVVVGVPARQLRTNEDWLDTI